MSQNPKSQREEIKGDRLMSSGGDIVGRDKIAQKEEWPPDKQDTWTRGVDVSQLQQTVDWGKVRANGIVFAFIKATEGGNTVDPMFKYNWTTAQEVGIRRGAYHVFLSASEPIAQAEFFLGNAHIEAGDLPPALVVSDQLEMDRAVILEGIEVWLDTVEQKVGRPPILYMLWDAKWAMLDEALKWEKYPLWVAYYSSETQPQIPQGLSRWEFWQYSIADSIDGISGEARLNRFNGTLEDLRVFAGATAAPTPSPKQSIPVEPPTGGSALNDRPGGKDQLGYDEYALALARVLTNPNTRTPLTVGIYGSWGAGKSFLMRRVQAQIEALLQAQRTRLEVERHARPVATKIVDWLREHRPVDLPDQTSDLQQAPHFRSRIRNVLKRIFTRPPPADVSVHFVEFNAWVYSGSENLWAGMITQLYDGVEKDLGLWHTAYFRLGQTTRAAFRKTVWLLALYGLLGFGISLLLNFDRIRDAINNLNSPALGTFVSGVAGLAAGGAAGAALGAGALAALPSLINALRDLANSVTLTRSRQLASLASRHDFRDKIGFMADIKDEIKIIRKLLDQGRHGTRTRLLIFIDDLDRCAPSKAVEVLEAIMLLLADDDGAPFVVLLGIDARVIVKAIEERYGTVLSQAGITGYEYLDKIVQIPFSIPPVGGAALQNYVESLLYPTDEERDRARQMQNEKTRLSGPANKPKIQSLDQLSAGSVQGSTQPTEGKLVPSPVPEPRASLSVLAETPFEAEEEAAFTSYAEKRWIGWNPRRVKRIVNTYRIARMLVRGTTTERRQKLIKWVVLTERWPYRMAWIMQQADYDEHAGTEFATRDGTSLHEVFEAVRPRIESKAGQSFLVLDGDPEMFEEFIVTEPDLTIADLRWFRPLTFNLNPALQSEVLKASSHSGDLDKTPPSLLQFDPSLEKEMRELLRRFPAEAPPKKS